MSGRERAGETEQLRNRETPDIGVEESDRMTGLSEGNREIDGHRRFADPAFSATDRDHLAALPEAGAGTSLLGVQACPLHHAGALVGIHFGKRDGDGVDPGMAADGFGDVVGNPSSQGAGAGGQLDSDVGVTTVDLDVADHSERDDVDVEFGVDHRCQRRPNLLDGGSRVQVVVFVANLHDISVRALPIKPVSAVYFS